MTTEQENATRKEVFTRAKGHASRFLKSESRRLNDTLFTLSALAEELLTDNMELLEEKKALLRLTELLDEHPEDYEGPCSCKLCMSYAVEG